MLFSLICISFTSQITAQSISSVAGCKFGSSKDSVDLIMLKRYKAFGLDKGDKITYNNVEIAGIRYDYVDFMFAYKDSNYVFCGANLVNRFKLDQYKRANNHFDNILYTYLGKYNLQESYSSKDKNKSYFYCDEKYNTLDIKLYKGESVGGDLFYWTIVCYRTIFSRQVNDDI